MKPTDEQLADPKWWDENAPHDAEYVAIAPDDTLIPLRTKGAQPMITALIMFWLGGVVATAPEVYEDWQAKMIDWDDAIMAVILWPVVLVMWMVREWRG